MDLPSLNKALILAAKFAKLSFVGNACIQNMKEIAKNLLINF
jgi:hypothetical protein